MINLRTGPPKIARHDIQERRLRLCEIPPPNGLQKGLSAATQSVAEKILDRIGLSPYVVVASFDRTFIDANRARSPVNCAFTDAAAKPFYDEYHNRVAGFINEIRGQNDNRGFLFDIHGKVEIPEIRRISI